MDRSVIYAYRNLILIAGLLLLAGFLVVPQSAKAATRTIADGGGNWSSTSTWVEGAVPTASDDVVATATSGNVTIDAAANCRSIDLTGYTGTLTHAAGITLSIGDGTAGANNNALVFPSSGWTYTLGSSTSSAISFVSTSTTVQNINPGGKTFGNTTFDGVGGSWILASDLNVSSATITLTNGTFDMGNFNVTGKFSSSNSNVRTLTMGSGTWTIPSNASATVWTTQTSTNLTLNRGSNPVSYTRTSVSPTTISGSASEDASPSFSITCSSSSNLFTIQGGFYNFTLTGTITAPSIIGSRTIYGDIVLNSNIAGNRFGGATTLGKTSGTQTITSNGGQFNHTVTASGGAIISLADAATISGLNMQLGVLSGNGFTHSMSVSINTSGTVTLGSNLALGSSKVLTLQAGTFNASGYNVTVGLVQLDFNNCSLNMGSGAWTITGTGSVWSTVGTNLTLTPSTSTLSITDTSATAKTFAGGGLTYGTTTFSGDNITISGNNTFSTLNVNNAGLTTGLIFTSGSTQTITSSFTTNGSLGSIAKISASTGGSAATLSKSSETVTVSYTSITDSAATGGATWDASDGTNTDGTGNSGWNFGGSNTAPTFTATGNSGSPAKLGATVTFTSSASDSDVGDTVQLFICKSNDFSGGACGAAGEWAHSSTASSDPSATYTIQSSDTDGTKTYYAYIIDNHSLESSSNPQSNTFVIDQTAPTVDAGADQSKSSSFTQVSTDSDATSGIATYQWVKTSGPGTITFGTDTADSTTISADTNGTYVITLTVTDNAGNSNSDNFTLTWSTGGGGGNAYSSAVDPCSISPLLCNLPKPSIDQTQITQLQSLINSLKSQIQAILNARANLSSVDQSTSAYHFTHNLKLGDNDPDVLRLQQFLNTHGFIINPTPGQPGSPGHETTLFGYATKNALIKLQEAHTQEILQPYSYTKGTGFFGPKTREWVNGQG